MVVLEKWPVLARHESAVQWLQVWADLGRSPRTIDAYARALAEFLLCCERHGFYPVTAGRAQIGLFLRKLTSRPSRRGADVVVLDSGAGLANATLQQRLVAVRLYYDFLIEEGLREANPVGRGRDTPDRGFSGGGSSRGLVPRLAKLPWIPPRRNGVRCSRFSPPSRSGTGSCWRWHTTRRSAVRSCAHCGPTTSIPAGGCCGSGPRPPRLGPGGWCRTRRRQGRCSPRIFTAADRSAGRGDRSSCPSHGATTVNR